MVSFSFLAQRRNSSQSYRQRKSKDYSKTHSTHSPSPSSPISANEGSDSDGSPVNRQKQRLRQLQNAVMETSGRSRGVLKRQKSTGPRTPDSAGSDRAATPEDEPPRSPRAGNRRKSLTAGTIEGADKIMPVAVGQVVAERVVADSNTPEVSEFLQKTVGRNCMMSCVSVRFRRARKTVRRLQPRST